MIAQSFDKKFAPLLLRLQQMIPGKITTTIGPFSLEIDVIIVSERKKAFNFFFIKSQTCEILNEIY